VALIPLGQDERDRMVDAGILSDAARELPFSRYEAYAPHVPPCEAHFGTGVLDRATKPEPSPLPNANYNYACFVPIYRQEGHDAVVAIRRHPGWYARSVGANVQLFLSNPRGNPKLGDLEGGGARTLDRAYAVVQLRGHTMALYPHLFPIVADYQVSFVVGVLLVLALAGRAARRAVRRQATATDLVALVVGETVVVISLICLLADAFESGRFRAPLNPLVYGTLFACVLEGIARVVDARKQGAAPAPSLDEPVAVVPAPGSSTSTTVSTPRTP